MWYHTSSGFSNPSHTYNNASHPVHEGNAGLLYVAVVDPVQPSNVGVAHVLHLKPVEGMVPHGEAIVLCSVDHLQRGPTGGESEGVGV